MGRTAKNTIRHLRVSRFYTGVSMQREKQIKRSKGGPSHQPTAQTMAVEDQGIMGVTDSNLYKKILI